MLRFLLLMVGAVIPALAQEPDPQVSKVSVAPRSVVRRFGFGVGLGVHWNQAPSATAATLTGLPSGVAKPIFSSTPTRSSHPGFLAEGHYLLWRKEHVGIGPFVGFQPGTDQIVSAFGGGAMVVWRFSKSANEGIAVGFGYAAVPSVGDAVVSAGVFAAAPPVAVATGTAQTHTAGAPLFTVTLTF